jgi:hypothetical protein
VHPSLCQEHLHRVASISIAVQADEVRAESHSAHSTGTISHERIDDSHRVLGDIRPQDRVENVEGDGETYTTMTEEFLAPSDLPLLPSGFLCLCPIGNARELLDVLDPDLESLGLVDGGEDAACAQLYLAREALPGFDPSAPWVASAHAEKGDVL